MLVLKVYLNESIYVDGEPIFKFEGTLVDPPRALISHKPDADGQPHFAAMGLDDPREFGRVKVMVTEVRDSQNAVKFAFDAPPEIQIDREVVHLSKQENKAEG